MRELAGPINPLSFRTNITNFSLSTALKRKKQEITDDDREAYYASHAAYGNTDYHQKLLDRGYLKDDLSTHNTYVYNNGKKTLVSYRGTTNDKNDFDADSSIAVGLQNLHPEFLTAREVGKRAKAKYNNDVIFTGHSLGGTKAVESSRVNGGRSIVFNPGTSHIAPLDTTNSTVHRTSRDYISYNTTGSKPLVYEGDHSLKSFESFF